MTGTLKRIAAALGRSTRVCFRVTFADGSSWQNLPAEPVVHFRFKTAASQWRTALFGNIGLLESYFDQSLEVEGDFARAFSIAFEVGFDRSSGPAGVGAQPVARAALRQPQHRAGQGECPLPLRPGGGVLRLVAGSAADDVHLRVLEGGHAQRRGGAAQQDRPRVPQDRGSRTARAWWTSAAASAASCSGRWRTTPCACAA